MIELSLKGLKSDNLLAFLALLGLLKCLEVKDNDLEPRVTWKNGSPLLYINRNKLDKKEILDYIVKGIEAYAQKMKFKGIKNIGSITDFKELEKSLDHDVITVLGSSAILNKGKKKIVANALCMMFGSGHQDFLTRLENATCLKEDREQIIKSIHDALFFDWYYVESKLSFRWDPKEYRSHALRSSDPKKDPVTCVSGACRLAAIGFLAYVCVPTAKGLGTVSCVGETVYWPIWNIKLSLTAILTIMHHPNIKMLSDKQKIKDIRDEFYGYGIEQIMSSELFWDDRFKNSKNAKRVI